MTIDETENTGEQPSEPSLDDFEKDFYPHLQKEEEQVEETEEETVEDTEEVEDLETESEEAPEEEEGEEPEEEEEPKSKKKHTAKDRIDKLTAEKYEERRAREVAERRAYELEERIRKLEASREKEEPRKTLQEQLPAGAPTPEDLDEDGEPKYPLGDFDKNYIRDLTKFTIAEEARVAKEKEAQETWNRNLKAAQQELTESYSEKLDKYEEEVPTVREDITHLVDAFANVPEDYGEYLAMTIMGAENAPAIMHYFSQNIGEAQKIVAAGPSAATFAIGRLDAQMSKNKPSSEQNEQKSDKKVSPTKAAPPPEGSTRGNSGRQTIRPDTDNLDAFEKIFYPPKK